MTLIKISYQSIDYFQESRTFKTLAGAQRYAHKLVGEHPEIGSHYAVSGDGIGKVYAQGATLAEMFPSNEPVSQPHRGYRSHEQMQGDCGQDDDGPRDNIEACQRSLNRAKREGGCTCTENNLGQPCTCTETDRNGFPLLRAKGCICTVMNLELIGCDCECPGGPVHVEVACNFDDMPF